MTAARQAAVTSSVPVRTGARARFGAPQIVHEVLRAPGRPLDGPTRTLMESRFGHDFGRVRVHADERAAESARAVNAKAYAVGSHIVFNAGEYQPRTAVGLGSLAHELTHVLQQGAGRTGPIPKRIEIGVPGDSVEREAELIGRGGGPPVVPVQDRPCLRKQTQGEDQIKKEPPPLIPLPIFDRLDIKPIIPGPVGAPSLEDINKGLFFLRGQGQAGAGNVGCALGWKMRKDGLCCEGSSVDKCCPPYRLTMLGRCCPSDQYAKGAECMKFNLPTPTLPGPVAPKSPVLPPQGRSS